MSKWRTPGSNLSIRIRFQTSSRSKTRKCLKKKRSTPRLWPNSTKKKPKWRKISKRRRKVLNRISRSSVKTSKIWRKS